jgi:predicted nucleotidyltransferase
MFGEFNISMWPFLVGLRSSPTRPPECGRTLTMHEDIARKRSQLSALCRRFGVERLELFGSAARGADFDPARSDADFLVTFAPEVANDLVRFLDFKEAIEAELGRAVDLVERAAVEASRNPIRRRHILSSTELIHG